MITFWCTWCGETGESGDGDDIVPCLRCAAELSRLFGFRPRTAMIPLLPGEMPGEPAAARKRFTFVECETGRIVGTTSLPPPPGRARRKRSA